MDSVAQSVLRDIKRKAPAVNYTPAMLMWREYNEKGHCSDVAADIACHMYKDKTQSEIIQALLLSECPAEDITKVFLVPTESVNIYRELFFDTRKFRTKLDKLSYVENYPDLFGQELKKRALNLGYEYVLYTYGNIVPKTDGQKNLVQRMFMSTAYKAMSMNFNGITTNATKQSVEHAKVMLKAYEALEKSETGTVDGAFELARVLVEEEKLKDCETVSADVII